MNGSNNPASSSFPVAKKASCKRLATLSPRFDNLSNIIEVWFAVVVCAFEKKDKLYISNLIGNYK